MEIKKTEYVVIPSCGPCVGGHHWTFAGGRDYVLEGTLCDCGEVKYPKPCYCESCGQQIPVDNPLGK